MPISKKKVKPASSRKKKPKRGRVSTGVYITKGMPLHEVLSVHPETLKVFVEYDMACLGDEHQHAMTLDSWAMDHDVSTAYLLKQLQSVARSRHSPKRKSHPHKGL